MERLLEDLRYASRIFRRSPAFVVVIVLTLALGIGANTSIFSLMNAVLLKSLPVKHAKDLAVVGDPTLVHFRATGHPPHTDIFSYRLYTELRDANNVFSEMLLTGELQRTRVTRGGGQQEQVVTEQATGVLVSGNYFETLGVDAFRGRLLTPQDDDKPGAHPVAVISYGFWKDKLGQNPSILGSTLQFNGYPFTIIGIAQRGFFGDTVGDQQDAWFPVTMQRQVVRTDLLNGYKNSWFHVIGRLKTNTTATQAAANLNVIFQGLLNGPLGDETQFISKESLHNLRIEVADGRGGFSQVRARYHEPLLLLMGIVGLVLLIACANVANLLLSRALSRRREVAVRLALGAGAGRLVQQLLTENMLLAITGGAAGLLLARWGSSILLAMTGTSGTVVVLDWRVLTVTVGLCVLTGLLFGLVPALRAVDVALADTLKSRSDASSSFGTEHSNWSWGKVLVAGQVSLSVLVLFVGGLLVRSMKNLRNVDPRLNQSNVLILRVLPGTAGYQTAAQRTQLSEEIARRISALPGVRAITYSQNGLYYSDEAADTIRVDGFVPKSKDDLVCMTDRTGPNYFRILGIPLREGRELTEQDSATAPKVTVINEAAAQFYFGSVNPIGRTLWITDDEKPEAFQIVGVVANVRDHALRGKIAPRFYVDIAQSLDAVGALFFMVRTSQDPEQLASAARAVVQKYDSALPILNVATLGSRIDESIRSDIAVAKLSGTFGVLALLLACLGLYGVISYTVTRQTRAIGVRMALGAQQTDVLWMVLRDAMTLVIAGALVGVPAALACGRLLGSMLYGVGGSDPASMAAVIALLAIVALAAGYIPAWRAMKVDPLVALRDE